MEERAQHVLASKTHVPCRAIHVAVEPDQRMSRGGQFRCFDGARCGGAVERRHLEGRGHTVGSREDEHVLVIVGGRLAGDGELQASMTVGWRCENDDGHDDGLQAGPGIMSVVDGAAPLNS